MLTTALETTTMRPRRTLNHVWVFFVEEDGPRLTMLAEVYSAKDFWWHFEKNNVSSLQKGHTLSICVKGVKPQSTDPSLSNGGQLRIVNPTTPHAVRDDYKLWLDISMALVAEQLRQSHIICGASFHRSHDESHPNTILLWLASREPTDVQSVRDDLVFIINRAEMYSFAWHRTGEEVRSPKCDELAKFRRTNSAPELDDDDYCNDDSVLGPTSPSGPPQPDSTRKKKAPPALDPNNVPTAQRNTAPAYSSATLKPKKKRRARSQGQSREFVVTVRVTSRSLLGFKSLPVTPSNLSPEYSAVGPKKKVPSQSATPVAHFKVIAPTPVAGLWSDAPWTPSYLVGGHPTVTPPGSGSWGLRGTDLLTSHSSMSGASSNSPLPPVPLGAEVKTIDDIATEPPRKSPPMMLKVECPPPRSPQPKSPAQAPRSPLPKSPVGLLPLPLPAPTRSPSPPSDNLERGDIVAAAFVYFGWLYPEGLNRKTRRRIQFAPEFVPTEIENSCYIGTDIPDGQIGKERYEELAALRLPMVSIAQYLAQRAEFIESKMRDRNPKENKEYTPPKSAARGRSSAAGTSARGRGSSAPGRGAYAAVVRSGATPPRRLSNQSVEDYS